MIDIRTLLVLVAVADASVAIILWLGAGRRLRLGMGAWIASLMVRALAVSVLASGVKPRAGTLAVAAALLALSMTLQARRPPRLRRGAAFPPGCTPR